MALDFDGKTNRYLLRMISIRYCLSLRVMVSISMNTRLIDSGVTINLRLGLISLMTYNHDKPQ